MPARECSKTTCSSPAVSTLTFVYEDSTAVLGPLARTSEPNTYDLCREHAERMTTPRGWELLRVPGVAEASDDLVALADAVRPRQDPPASGGGAASGPESATSGRRPDGPERGAPRHLHVLRSPHD